MKNAQKNRAKFFFFGIIIVCIAAAAMFLMPQAEKASYSKFQADLKAEQVSAVDFQEDVLEVSLKDGTKYTVPNPDSPLLKEQLLLQDVKISDSKSFEETLSLVFDAAFYLFFFGIIFVAFRKFISPNTFKVVRKTGVTFKDVIGMNQLKKDMQRLKLRLRLKKHARSRKL